MPTYLIERDIPGVGRLSADEHKAISQRSCDILKTMGPEIQWLESFVTEDRIYCLYIAPNERMIREHAEAGGFPITAIRPVCDRINPGTAE
ncbi:MAG: DUF4242 domain-containing protein [Methylococcus sp.]|jgi:hypothetical protein|nr:MAG: DUF4242 domain-containing protein [Methylococcus sp.]